MPISFFITLPPALEKVRNTADFERPVRSDYLPHPANVLNQILERISCDDLCIAVLTDQKANVYYELAQRIQCEGAWSNRWTKRKE